MLKITKKAFSLIELLVAMTIFFIIVMMTYAPYNYYQNKQKLRQATKEISQSLYDARNMAINWYSSTWSNLSIWLFFDNSDSEKNKLTFFSFPYSILDNQIIPSESASLNIKIIKEILLPQGIQIDKIWSNDKFMFYFSSIDWVWKYFSYDDSLNKTIYSSQTVDIDISYKWSSSVNLNKTLKYLTPNNIVDY